MSSSPFGMQSSGRCTSFGPASVFALLITAICSQAAPAPASATRFLRPRFQESGKRKSALLLSTKSSPFFRSEGVRGGAEVEAMGELGDSGGRVDSELDSSWVRGASMALHFPMLDNMNPIAPMDRLHAAMGRDSVDSASSLSPIYVPEYLNPDAFPTVHGKGCNCSMPEAPDKKIECSCGKNDGKAHYTWLNDNPVVGTNNYTLEPADITYRGGNYWAPHTRDGLVAPADTLPLKNYPNQALADHIWPLPASAQEDRIGVKYTRYLDQVNARSRECDTISEKCTVPCKPGDDVIAKIGNVDFKAKVIKAFVGNAMQVEFAPSAGQENDSTSCPVQAGCTAYRYCKSDKTSKCTSGLVDKERHNWAGLLIRKHKCPSGTKVCKTVNQVVMANLLVKGDKACKAKAR